MGERINRWGRAVALVAAVSAVVGLGGTYAASAQDTSNGIAQAKFVGSWRLVSFETRTADGQVQYPFGKDAGGVITYTKEGRVSATLWKANRQPFAVNDQQKGTADEYTAAVQTYVSYIGTFDVSPASGVVSHHVEQSVFPNWNGGTQRRFYEFSDNGRRLELTTPPIAFGGTTVVAAVVWDRIED